MHTTSDTQELSRPQPPLAEPALRGDVASTGRERRARWWSGAASPRLGAREIVLVVLGGAALAVLTSWPLVLHLGSRIGPDLGDPTRTAWQIAWVGHALLTHPLHLWSTNAFWPHTNSLAFSDSLLGYGPAGLIGSGVTAAIVRYNLLFLLAWTLPFVGAYLLGRELGLRPAGAVVAGAAFAYAPFRAAAAGHLHVLSSGGIPLALFLLVRGYRRSSVALVIAGWVVAAWQLSLGFTLALPFGYTLAVLALVGVVVWWRRRRPALPRGLVVATACGVLLFGAVGIYEARPYLQVSHNYPTAKRRIKDVERYSAPPKAWLAAPYQNRVWGSATAGIRNKLRSRNEDVLFPGLTILVLALVGLAFGRAVMPRRLRWSLAGAAVVFAVLALGLGLTGAGYPYRLLYDYVPGWNGVRVPARVIVMTALALALLAGAGAHVVVDACVARLARRRGAAGAGPDGGTFDAAGTGAPGPRDGVDRDGAPAGARWLRGGVAVPLVVSALLLGLVVFEGAGRQNHLAVPRAPVNMASLPGPLLMLPTDSAHDRIYQLWSSAGFPRIANGVSTFEIPAETDLRGGMQNFPDRPGVEKLRRLGIRTVVLVTGLEHAGLPPVNFETPEPPNPQQAASKSIAGIPGVTRRRMGSVVVFEIAPLHARRSGR